MKSQCLPFALALFAGILPVTGQEAAQDAPEWDVEIPGPIADGTPSEPAPKPVPLRFNVKESRTFHRDVKEAPPMPGLPPVTGTINITVQLVEDPRLPDPPPPLPALPPEDPAVVARIKEVQREHRGTELAFVSCQVVDHRRSLLRVYPTGETENSVVAISNIDFNHFSGWATYRVNHTDGSTEDVGLVMGISNEGSGRLEEWAAHAGLDYKPRKVPELADIEVSGPAFAIVDGKADSRAVEILQQAHSLYRTSGQTLEEAYLAREKAQAERRAYLLKNPPKPDDVSIQFWKRN
jgi:hypothetical protein